MQMRIRIRGAAAATSVMLATTLALAGCGGTNTTQSGGSSTGAASGGTLTIGEMFDNNSFDRVALEIGNRIEYWMPVFDTLFVLDDKAQPQPNLATKWSYNSDKTVLDLKLREGVKFTDGTPFDAEAVKTNLSYLAKGTGQNSYMTKSIASYDIVSPTEIKLNLSAPDPGLLGYLGVVGGAMASPKTLTNNHASATTPVGSGPYTLDASATTPGTQYTYVRNPDYWNTKAFPYDRLVLKPIPDGTARLNALKSGQVDVGPIEAKSVAEAKGSGLSLSRVAVDWQGLFLADRAGDKVPALGDVRVRQAINYVFDKKSILKNLQLGEGTVTSQTFNDSSPANVPALDSYYTYDLTKAKQLMADAGYANGFTVTMPDLAALPQYAPVIQQQLAQINIKVSFEKVAADATISALLSGKFPMFWFSLGSQSPWQDLRKFAFKESPWNTAHVDDPKMDEMLKTAQYAQGDAQPAEFQKINTYMVENGWFAPWYHVNIIIAHSPKVNLTMNPYNAVPWISGFTPVS
jgi:peptide/nickel transport system substrate-binding protein